VENIGHHGSKTHHESDYRCDIYEVHGMRICGYSEHGGEDMTNNGNVQDKRIVYEEVSE